MIVRRLIIDHYPIASIKEIGHFWSGPWDQLIVHLFSRTITLDAIEQGMLRKDYQDLRIHFALVCASNCTRLTPFVKGLMNSWLAWQR